MSEKKPKKRTVNQRLVMDTKLVHLSNQVKWLEQSQWTDRRYMLGIALLLILVCFSCACKGCVDAMSGVGEHQYRNEVQQRIEQLEKIPTKLIERSEKLEGGQT